MGGQDELAALREQGETFEEYRAALEGAGPRLKELILHRAEHEADISFGEFMELYRTAYPDE